MVEIELLDDDSDPRDFSKMLLDVNIEVNSDMLVIVIYILCVAGSRANY